MLQLPGGEAGERWQMVRAVSVQELSGLDETTPSQVWLNVVERLVTRLQAVEEELGRARDEINRLKGEQGRPGGLQKKDSGWTVRASGSGASHPRRGTSGRSCRRS